MDFYYMPKLQCNGPLAQHSLKKPNLYVVLKCVFNRVVGSNVPCCVYCKVVNLLEIVSQPSFNGQHRNCVILNKKFNFKFGSS